ncbi:hypothetical protein Agub_g3893 [Astrephomene gubernaculifera]|uniref:Uncharacterized protein n=1 Tax=Astrephomene gubernaculifera TaxID=47775 RepID=A0AAD3DJB9_9CHLO|nr:hypothetical protein Agub_g3893 [Astrephomene gubernaculifera]
MVYGKSLCHANWTLTGCAHGKGPSRNFPARGGANSDALVGHQRNYFIPIRAASRLEATSQLQQPVFSSCTLPVILETDWPYNMGEVFAQLAAIADVYFRQKKMLDDSATIVVSTPLGLASTSYHHVLLSPYSRYPPVSFDELSQRAEEGRRVGWSAEGHHVRCFEKAVLCKLHGFPQNLLPTSQSVLRHIAPHIPKDPLGFGAASTAAAGGSTAGPATTPTATSAAVAALAAPAGGIVELPGDAALAADGTLRVLLEARSGQGRTIRNLAQLVEACEVANARGFHAGSFSRLSCKVLNTADTPSLNGVDRFYATVGAVRSAHVLVAVHGAGAANCFFLRPDNGLTALLEIRPCRFGSKHCGWPDAYMQSQLSQAGGVIRFFAYNVEDPAQCAPSDYEVAATLPDPAGLPLAPLRGGEDARARDQHLTLRPKPFIAMLRHVGSLLRNETAYQAAHGGRTLHGYAIPEGLAFGPLCVQDMAAHLQSGAPVLHM